MLHICNISPVNRPDTASCINRKNFDCCGAGTCAFSAGFQLSVSRLPPYCNTRRYAQRPIAGCGDKITKDCGIPGTGLTSTRSTGAAVSVDETLLDFLAPLRTEGPRRLQVEGTAGFDPPKGRRRLGMRGSVGSKWPGSGTLPPLTCQPANGRSCPHSELQLGRLCGLPFLVQMGVDGELWMRAAEHGARLLWRRVVSHHALGLLFF